MVTKFAVAIVILGQILVTAQPPPTNRKELFNLSEIDNAVMLGHRLIYSLNFTNTDCVNHPAQVPYIFGSLDSVEGFGYTDQMAPLPKGKAMMFAYHAAEFNNSISGGI